MTFKDLFGAKSTEYARFRPTYPSELFAWLAAQAPSQSVAVDVGTGSGQAAHALAEHFDQVLAVDPSQRQLDKAMPHPRVRYSCAPAEATGLPAHAADLMIAAQAFHWFKHEAFFQEVRRVVKPGGVLAVWTYALSTVTPEVDAVVYELYEPMLGRYWEPERKLVEEGYASVTVPFTPLVVPPFPMRSSWTLEQLVGYLRTWSPLPRYMRDHGHDPFDVILPKLERAWGAVTTRDVVWPLAIRAFRC